MQFLTITRRSGEEIPINPLQVTHVRQIGPTTVVGMSSGHEVRVTGDLKLMVAAIQWAANAGPGDEPGKPVIEPPAIGDKPAGDPAQASLGGFPQATAPAGQEGAQAAEDDLTEGELALQDGEAQRAQEADPKPKPKPKPDEDDDDKAPRSRR